MTDVQNTTSAAEKRDSKISQRLAIGPDGTEVDNQMEATGARYVYLEEEGHPTVEAQVDDLIKNGHKDVVCAMFAAGWVTIAGNVANRIRNGQVKDDGPQTVGEALKLWYENLMSGNWTTPRGEVEAGVGLLAEALKRAKDKIDGGTLPDGTMRTIESVTTAIKAMTKDEKKAWRKKVAVEISEIQLERRQKEQVDNTALLASAAF